MSEPTFVSPKKYAFTFIALMLLLAATFGLAHLDLGPFSVAAALLIASAKALLVVLYFMQIRFESGLNRVASVVGIFWVGILVALVLSDYLSRNWLYLPSSWP